MYPSPAYYQLGEHKRLLLRSEKITVEYHLLVVKCFVWKCSAARLFKVNEMIFEKLGP